MLAKMRHLLKEKENHNFKNIMLGSSINEVNLKKDWGTKNGNSVCFSKLEMTRGEPGKEYRNYGDVIYG